MNELEHGQDVVTSLAMEYGPRLLSAVLILLIGYVVMQWAAKLTARGLVRFTLEPPVRGLIVRVVRLLVFLLFLIMALQNLGIELLPLIAGLGIVGAGIALALQGVLGNVAAGLTIIFTRPFRVGEYLSIAGEILHNYGMIRQLNLRISLARAADIDPAAGAIREVLASSPRVLAEPVPLIQTVLLGEWSVTLAAKPWVTVTDYDVAIGELNAAIARVLRERSVQLQTAAISALPIQAANEP